MVLSTDNIIVSVYIPTYNRLALLKEAISSVLDQSYPSIEILVVDDGSSDGTWEFLQSFCLLHDRVKAFRNVRRKGACGARNTAILNASGKFITGLDDDDVFCRPRVENFLSAWSSMRSSGKDRFFLFSNRLLSESNTARVRKSSLPDSVNVESLFVDNGVGNQVFAELSVMKSYLFNEAIPMLQDLDCWIRLARDMPGYNTKCYDYIVRVFPFSDRISSQGLDKINHSIRMIKSQHINYSNNFLLDGILLSYGYGLKFNVFISIIFCSKLGFMNRLLIIKKMCFFLLLKVNKFSL